MKIRVIADLHLFAPNELKVELNGSDPNEYMLGDVVDLDELWSET